MTDIIRLELDNLERKCDGGEWFAAIWAVKDSYEIMVKYVCLMVCALANERDGDDSFYCLLTDPGRSMSLGDWCSDVMRAARDSEFVKTDGRLSAFFKKLVKLTEDTKIVSWRNNTLGHGAMKFFADEQMKAEILERKDKLISFADDWQDVLDGFAEKCDAGYRDRLYPFIMWEDGNLLLFDSMERDGVCRYLDVTDRRRVGRNEVIWTEKRKKFHDNLTVLKSISSSEDGYDPDIDEMLAAFHRTDKYEKPDYLSACVKEWLEKYPCGSFLICADRGTGKSAFVYACDELRHNKKEQRIRLSSDGVNVAVRAYYANRTEMLTPDEAERHLFELLDKGPGEKDVRIRGISRKEFEDFSFLEKVKLYFRRYQADGNVDKLVIFIDGIDELNEGNGDILSYIPGGHEVPEGIYFVCMCRSWEEGIPANIIAFCKSIDFTEVRRFDREKENAELIRRYMSEHLHLEAETADEFIRKLDYRFSAVSLLAYMGEADLRKMAEGSAGLGSRELLAGYFERLKLRYGAVYFQRLLWIAAIIAEAPGEALTMQEVAWLAEGHGLTTRELAFFYDLRPLLMEYRDYRGAVYGISNVGWLEAFREVFPDTIREIALSWEQDLLLFNTAAEAVYSLPEWNAYLYKSSVIIPYLERFGLPVSDGRLFEQIAYIATRFKEGSQSHVTYRSLRCYNTLFDTYILRLKQAYDADTLLWLLAVFNTCAKQHADLHMESRLPDMAGKVEEAVRKYQDHWSGNTAINTQLLFFYSNMICVCGDSYALEKGKEYFEKAEKLYKNMKPARADEQRETDDIWTVIFQNATAMFRYSDPEEAVRMAETMLDTMRKWQGGYHDINVGCVIAMCYLSAGRYISAYGILRECMERMEELPGPRNPYENETYIVTVWRYCQRVHEMYGLTDITVEDIEEACLRMDQILDYLVRTEQRGFGELSRWKPQMVMTAALMQGKLAEIKSREAGLSDEVRAHLAAAVEMASAVPAIYDEWDRMHIEYDRVSAMHNFLNVGAVYAEAFRPDEGVRVIERALEKYLPENETEEKVQDMMRKMIDRILTNS